MRIWMMAALFLWAGMAHAQVSRMKVPALVQEPTYLKIYPLNPEMRYERNESQEMVDRKPLNIALGLQKRQLSLLMEYARFKEDSGNATSSIERSHQEILMWFRYHFLNQSQPEGGWNLFAGAGAGVYEEEVITTLMGASRTDKSNSKFMSGLVLGGEALYFLSPKFALTGGIEGRGLFASDFDPNPVWSAVLRLGIQFSL